MTEEKNIPQEENEISIDLIQLFFKSIRGCIQFWWLLVFLAFIGGSCAYLISSKSYTPMYRAVSTFTVSTNNTNNPNNSANYNFFYDSSTAGQLATTFPYILSSSLLTDAMKADLDMEVLNGTVSAKAIPNSNMVTMYGTSKDPEAACNILKSAIRVYPSVARFVIGEIRFNMIDLPSVPAAPFNIPNYRRQTLLGMAAGLILGLGLIVLGALFRKTVYNTGDLENFISVPCLVTLPAIHLKKHKKERFLLPSVLDYSINPWFSENVETLRLRTAKTLDENKGKILLVTSTAAQEGKSLVAANLAYKLARHHQKVLLVDANLRKQDLASALNITSGFGIEAVLTGEHTLEEAITYDEKGRIYFLGGDRPAKNIPQLLSDQFRSILESEAVSKMDYIILDAPACGGLEDAVLLGSYSDAILYVIRQNYIAKNRILDNIASLETDCSTPIIGYVFNGSDDSFPGYGGYGYGRYGYGRYGYSRYGKYGYYGKYGHYSKYSHYSKYGYGYGYGEKSGNQKQAVDHEKK